MSKKFFSLIFGDKVHIAPKTKVVAADAFSQLMTSQQILQRIQEEAERYREETVHESEVLKEHAQREGFEAGFQKWANHNAEMETEIKNLRKEFEKIIIPVALKAAKKILGREIELSDQAIVDIVANVLKSVSQHKKITIYVNKADLDKLEENKPRLKQIFEHLEVLSIRERDDVQSGGCIIETEAGIINAQIDNQWATLEHAFEAMMKVKK